MNLLHKLGDLIPEDSDFGDLARRGLALVVIALLIGVVISALMFGGAEYGYAKARQSAVLVAPDDARAEYYRGIYDVCMAYVSELNYCVGMVKHVVENDWYESPSDGWKWSDFR